MWLCITYYTYKSYMFGMIVSKFLLSLCVIVCINYDFHLLIIRHNYESLLVKQKMPFIISFIDIFLIASIL